MNESPIFSRVYDLLRWLITATVKFSRQQRFVLAAALQRSAFELQEQLICAAYSPQPLLLLKQADASLTVLRARLRLARDLALLDKGQYFHVAAMVNEIGRLLGGWIKKEDRNKV